MAIPLVKEPEEFASHFWGAVESCFFCKEETKHWHENTNNPVCPCCSKTHTVSELPDFGQKIRQQKRQMKAQANIQSAH
ncbi:MAG: hypothetical protein QM500_04920 [Methylococcales bacterium]